MKTHDCLLRISVGTSIVSVLRILIHENIWLDVEKSSEIKIHGDMISETLKLIYAMKIDIF